MTAQQKKITLAGLIMMMFTTIFGFANGPVGFYQVGFSSIIWYIIGASFYFLPTSMMYAEYGAAYKDAKGGLYSWMADGLGKKAAFIITFIGLSSWIVWMVGVSTKIWISLSTLVFGSDTTQSWSMFGLSSTQTLGILAALWVVLVTFFVSRGIDSVKRVSSFGGVAVTVINILFVLVSLFVLFHQGGHFAEPIKGVETFTKSPNPEFGNPLALIGFALYAIFAYGGLEQTSGVMDSVKDPEKTYPKAAAIATIVIGVGYSASILLWGVSANWADLHGSSTANLGNVVYLLMSQLGNTFGNALGLSHAGATAFAQFFARFTGLAMFLAYAGSFFVLVYAPIKSFILGTPKELWPAGIRKINKSDMPARALWLQCAIVVALILGVNFGGSDSKQVYLVLTNMANVSSTLPYVFLVLAFPFFKKLKNIDRSFVFYKSRKVMMTVVVIVEILLIAAIGMTIITPILQHDYFSAFWIVIGPLLFAVIAWIFFAMGEKRNGKAAVATSIAARPATKAAVKKATAAKKTTTKKVSTAKKTTAKKTAVKKTSKK